MISSLHGQVLAHDERSITLSVGGVGFLVFMAPRAQAKFPIGETVTIATHLHVREDAMELYGFATTAEQRLFEKLITVSGVGPRVALGVLSAAEVPDLEKAIERGEAAILTKVAGIGVKTAERIIVDLRGKLTRTESGGDNDLSLVIDALVNLGYPAREARNAAAATSAEKSVPDRVKQALQQIGR